MKYTAVVLGGTGLVGSFLIKELIKDEQCTSIKFITRRKTVTRHPKLEECIIDFNKTEDYIKYIKGDVLFSCLGTTLKQAGSKEQQYLVDYTYQYQAAKIAADNNVQSYVLVSSPWAKLASSNYYRKMKAQLEESILQLKFEKTIIIKPNGLIGKRTQPRLGEKFALRFFTFLSRIIPALREYTPIEAKKVAEVMLLSYYEIQQREAELFILKKTELNRFLEERAPINLKNLMN